MSLSFTIRAEGFEQLRERLLALTSQADSLIQQALLESARVNIVAVAKALAPVKTGALRGSIDAVPSDESPSSISLVAERPYAAFLEFGTRYIPEGKYSFMRPAVQEGFAQVVEDLNSAIMEALQFF
jgi:HK97 gp10 family phage protein